MLCLSSDIVSSVASASIWSKKSLAQSLITRTKLACTWRCLGSFGHRTWLMSGPHSRGISFSFFSSVRASTSCLGCNDGITTCRLVLLPTYLQRRGHTSALRHLRLIVLLPRVAAHVLKHRQRKYKTTRVWDDGGLPLQSYYCLFFTCFLNPTISLVFFFFYFPYPVW